MVHRPKNSTNSRGKPWPRYVNVAAALWLFASAFAWPHVQVLRAATWMIAVAMYVTGLWAVRAPSIRYANTVLAALLALATLAFRYADWPTVVNNLFVAVLVIIVSLVPNNADARPHRPAAR